MSTMTAADQRASSLSRYPVEITRSSSRRLSVRVKPDGHLNIRAPRWVSERQIERFIHEKQGWIQGQQRQLSRLYDLSQTPFTTRITIDYRESDELRAEVQPNWRLVIYRPAEQAEDWWQLYQTARPNLKRLLSAEAKQHIPPLVQQLESDNQLTSTGLRLRFTRSRWGSCSRQGVVMLNTQLLRLPSELQHYVICHELVHTKVFNHSAQFHDLLQQIRPGAKTLSRQLAKQRLLY